MGMSFSYSFFLVLAISSYWLFVDNSCRELDHSAHPDEIEDLEKFIRRVLPPAGH